MKNRTSECHRPPANLLDSSIGSVSNDEDMGWSVMFQENDLGVTFVSS